MSNLMSDNNDNNTVKLAADGTMMDFLLTTSSYWSLHIPIIMWLYHVEEH